MIDTTMGQRITRQRKKLGLSQEQLGEQLGVSRQSISRWEADGAVPEIDKLVAMSKLFCVSVGWLLGVEETEQPVQEEPLSEKQLELLDALMQKYHQPEKKGYSWLAMAVAAVAVLISLYALNRMGSIPDYSGQLAGVYLEYSSVHDQMNVLTEKLEQLQQGEQLLGDYALSAKALTDYAGAQITFTGVPNVIQPEEKAWLIALKDGKEVCTQPCYLEGASYRAVFPLSAADGYSYQFLVAYPDGSSRVQSLKKAPREACNLNSELQPSLSTKVQWSGLKNGKLSIDNVSYSVKVPALLYRENDILFTQAYMVLTVDGTEIYRRDMNHGASASSYAGVIYLVDLAAIDMEDGSVVQMDFVHELSNGIKMNIPSIRWKMKDNEIIYEGP